MTGTVKIVTIYNNRTGADMTALMNQQELELLLAAEVDVTVVENQAETVTAAEVCDRLKLGVGRC